MSLQLTSSFFARARVAPRRSATARALTWMGRPGSRSGLPPPSRARGGGGAFRCGSSSSGADSDAHSPEIIAPPWKEQVLDSHVALGNVCFVLCAPQGPQNCGAVARVMQNFGVYDLRLVNPGPFVLAGPSERPPEADARQTQQSDAHLPDDRGDAARFSVPDGANARGGVNSGASLGPDGLGFGDDVPEALRPTLPNAPPFQEEGNPDAVAPLCREAYRFACAADWLLADASRHETHLDAIADCTFVMATTARPRGNVPLVTARVAAAMVVEEAKRGKVAVLFGNERTGLTNEELAQAHACVAIPTAGRGSLCRKSLKYTGGTGPTSLNVSQAVGVLAYEIFMAADADKSAGEPEHASAASGSIGIPKAQLMTVGEKHVLKNELIAARRTLDVLAGDDVPLSRREGDIEEDVGEDYSDDREALGVERVLNAAPLQRRDAAALFQLARRVRAVSAGESLEGPLDAKVMRVVTSLDGETEAKPTVKRTRAKIREVLGVSLTDKEISKAIRRARRG